MTATTPAYAFPYPESLDAPNGPVQIQALAQAVENKLITVDAALAAAVAAQQASELAWRPKYLRKTNAENRTNSTLADDAVFAAVAFDAGQTWEVTLDLDYTGITSAISGQLKTTFVENGGLTIDRVMVQGMSDTDASSSDNITFVHIASRAPTGTISFGAQGSGTFRCYTRMTFTVTTTTAGSWTLRWAQVTTNATPTTLQASSRMIARRLA